MWILRSVMDRIWKLDAWILDRFQYLANLAYTRFETSPYAIAAKCFHAAGGSAIMGVGLIMTGQIGDESDRHPLVYALLFIVMVAMFFESYWAHKKHLLWKASKLPAHESDFRLPVLRVFWVLMVVDSIGATALGIILSDLELRSLFSHLFDISMMSAFYFLSCQPPTRIEKKQEYRNLVPNLG
jgi:hypothetical protein